jgi:hypothetical protein
MNRIEAAVPVGKNASASMTRSRRPILTMVLAVTAVRTGVSPARQRPSTAK